MPWAQVCCVRVLRTVHCPRRSAKGQRGGNGTCAPSAAPRYHDVGLSPSGVRGPFPNFLKVASEASSFKPTLSKLPRGEAEYPKEKVEKENVTTLCLPSNVSRSSALASNLHTLQKNKNSSVIGTVFHRGQLLDHLTLGCSYAL